MTSTHVEKIYAGRDNTIDLILKAKVYPATVVAAVDLAYVSRMQLVVGATTIDSSTSPARFNWTPAPAVKGKVTLIMGGAGLTAGKGQVAILYVFDPSNPNGIRWGTFHVDIE